MSKETDPSTGDAEPSADVFDVDRVRELVELMQEHDLSEVDLRQDRLRLRLRRGADVPMIAAPAPLPAQPVEALAPTPAVAAAVESAPPAEAAAGPVIKSPMVGTFYTSSSPEAAPFVKPGDQVGADSIVCIIEAMKVFNEIPAECSGKIAAVLVENGAAVEFGQPLFRLE